VAVSRTTFSPNLLLVQLYSRSTVRISIVRTTYYRYRYRTSTSTRTVPYYGTAVLAHSGSQ
jgi:hypothetical protein